MAHICVHAFFSVHSLIYDMSLSMQMKIEIKLNFKLFPLYVHAARYRQCEIF